jgi:DNA-binding transcriptional ArsR family regulator
MTRYAVAAERHRTARGKATSAVEIVADFSEVGLARRFAVTVTARERQYLSVGCTVVLIGDSVDPLEARVRTPSDGHLLHEWIYSSKACSVPTMRSKSPSLFPLARSNEQLLVLGEVFCSNTNDHAGLTGVEIARRTGVPQPTVSRELGRLSDAGWIRLRPLGTVKIAEPITAIPIFIPLRQLIASTVGVLSLLRDALGSDDRVGEAWIFGSWAARFHNEPGPFPNDVDLAVLGTISLPDAYRAIGDAQEATKMTISIRVYPPTASTEFLNEIRATGVVVKGKH